jgi:NAD(P)-dependent dehydrogenase (short-subunit alcohol dehydrogenase family)
VVVNDPGGAPDGSGTDRGPAEEVAEEIRGLGGEAVANADSVVDWGGAQRIVDAAVAAFGELDIVVNNAGILRDRSLVNMTEDEFDAVVAVHLKGTFNVLRFAAQRFRDEAKAGRSRPRNIVNTSSGSGLHGQPGQTNYAAAKAGVAAMTMVAAKELGRYGVQVNGIAPVARTRLTLATPGLGDLVQAPEDPAAFDVWDPANISPLVAYLASTACRFNGQVLTVHGDKVGLYRGWTVEDGVDNGQERWTVEGLATAMEKLPEAYPTAMQV